VDASWEDTVTDFIFRDRDSVAWRVVWCPAGAMTRVVGRQAGVPAELPAGFEFTCEAVRFRAPWPVFTDPRALRGDVLQRMIDRALGED